MRRNTLSISIATLATLLTIGLIVWYAGVVPTVRAPTDGRSEQVATTTPVSPQDALVPSPRGYYPYGTNVLSIGSPAGFHSGTSVRVLEVLEDSRCPQGVACVQAGTVRLSVRTNSDGSSQTKPIALGESLQVGTDTLTFVSVTPTPTVDATIPSSAYRFTFDVAPAPTVGEPGAASCYVGGCSSQLCTDQPNAVSTCEYRAEYACYKAATCARQSDGKCGWTQTSELAACLAAPGEVY